MLLNAACVMSYANPGDLQLHCHDKGSVTFNWMVKEELMRVFFVCVIYGMNAMRVLSCTSEQ